MIITEGFKGTVMNLVRYERQASGLNEKTRFAAPVNAVLYLVACAVIGMLLGLAMARHVAAAAYDGGWQLRLKDAAVIKGQHVTLGEIADPIGPIAPALWSKLAGTTLWPAPPAGRPMNMTRPKVQQAMAHYAGELSSLCLYPASMTLQQGGDVLDGDALQKVVVKALTPLLNALPGEASLQDFRLPGHVFVSHPGQTVELEDLPDLMPGRIPLRFAVKEQDGSVARRLSGTVFIDQWLEVPCAASPLNRDEALTPDRVTYIRKNLAHMKGTVWDGRGGPWRMLRAVGVGQPLLQTDVAVIPTVQKGATVTMLYQSKNFTLSMPGEALTDGAFGESITVRNLQSKKQLRAMVRDSTTVVVR